MTATPLPHKPTGKLAFAYQTIAALEQARADLEAENARLREALRIAITQNEHDMLMTGDELRAARAALEKQP